MTAARVASPPAPPDGTRRAAVQRHVLHCVPASSSIIATSAAHIIFHSVNRVAAAAAASFAVLTAAKTTNLPLSSKLTVIGKNVLIPKPRELISMFETLDGITSLDLPAGFVIS